MNRIIDFFYGRKTYITGVVMIVLGLLQGDSELVLQGVGLMTVRAGIAKIE
jgi:hypothetical protein